MSGLYRENPFDGSRVLDSDLDNPKSILCSIESAGSVLSVFVFEQEYYLWDQLEDRVYRIERPTEASDIIDGFMKNGMQDFELMELAPAELMEMETEEQELMREMERMQEIKAHH
ncbi:hypothetical protein DTO271D3_7235 [Paecilomyces variotii]|nr:hypothetical protein DTO169E5_2509 [Paecilomyces variotii]KAJ9257922.1 hypothetical protein DTO207G8_1699 [Paecilomyces variotii]KAJ9312533.1 hypothetical protein DTO271D3_7235 [Paecilomyces variotii]